MSNKDAIIVVKKNNHRFRFWVNENGIVEYTLDGEEKHILTKGLEDGRVIFKETIELFVDDDVVFYDGLDLNDLDYATLKGEQNRALAELKRKRDEVRVLTLEGKSKKELISMVDKWKKQIKKRKINKGIEKYTIHTFTIGQQNFRMIERIIDGEVVVNPDYKIFTDYPTAGGIAVKEGELMVWKYYFEKDEKSECNPAKNKGFWETARKMTFNEEICFEIIMRYGSFAMSQAKVSGL